MIRSFALLLVLLPYACSLPRVYATAHAAGQAASSTADQTDADVAPLTAGVVQSVSGLIDSTTGVFTAPRQGVYVVRGNVQFACLAGGCVLEEVWLWLAKKQVGGSWVKTGNGGVMDGTSAAYVYEKVSSNDNVHNLALTWMIELEANEQIKLVGRAKSSGGSTWLWSVAGSTYFHVISVD